ncbi:TPA: hypothetical protein DEP21_00535 [Patescibacteria group bacterium]|nr:hypothetical protein [Candidatus Gracilibacteria bacterium]
MIVVDGLMMDNFVSELDKQKDVDTILICGTNFSRWWKEDSLIVSNINSHKSLDFTIKALLS